MLDNKNEIEIEKEYKTKKWYFSKTIWFNLLSFIAAIFWHFTGFSIDQDFIIQIIAGINLVLRIATKDKIEQGIK